ncbi:MAG: phosphotransferase, partial [Planctomycetota bacterium]
GGGTRLKSVERRRGRLARWLDREGQRAAGLLEREPPSAFGAAARRLLGVLAEGGAPLRRRFDAIELATPQFPVLLDVHREHLLMVGERVTGLIDPAAARTDTLAADLARLAVSLEPGRLPGLITAYRTVRTFSETEAALAELLYDSGALLSGLAWVARGLWEGEATARSPAAIARMTHFAHVAERALSHG